MSDEPSQQAGHPEQDEVRTDRAGEGSRRPRVAHLKRGEGIESTIEARAEQTPCGHERGSGQNRCDRCDQEGRSRRQRRRDRARRRDGTRRGMGGVVPSPPGVTRLLPPVLGVTRVVLRLRRRLGNRSRRRDRFPEAEPVTGKAKSAQEECAGCTQQQSEPKNGRPPAAARERSFRPELPPCALRTEEAEDSDPVDRGHERLPAFPLVGPRPPALLARHRLVPEGRVYRVRIRLSRHRHVPNVTRSRARPRALHRTAGGGPRGPPSACQP